MKCAARRFKRKTQFKVKGEEERVKTAVGCLRGQLSTVRRTGSVMR